jgi:ribonuclease HI
MAKNMFLNGNLDKHIREVVIKTDSAYLVNSMVDYIVTWKRNGFINARGHPVASRDLIEMIDDICYELNWHGFQARFWHVPRSQNMQADKLANAALDGMDCNFGGVYFGTLLYSGAVSEGSDACGWSDDEWER